MMIFGMMSKPSVRHDKVRSELGAEPIVTKALYKTVVCILQIWKIDRHHYSQLALASSIN